ncbi:MAG: DNA repair protein RecO [Cyanobacteria bacterium P01_E01_bin.6]
MGGTYKATGINLKSIPMGESDRLLTILTREYGLIRAIAPGARKQKSSLRGRSNLFVINDLLIAKGRSLDKMIQAESVESFSGMSHDLGKLTAGQYLAELVLCQALTDHPQPDLFALLWEHLTRIDQRMPSQTLASLVQATYHLLAYAGLTPQVFRCCLSQQQITPDLSDPSWVAYFDASSGGIIAKSPTDEQLTESQPTESESGEPQTATQNGSSNKRRFRVLEHRASYVASRAPSLENQGYKQSQLPMSRSPQSSSWNGQRTTHHLDATSERSFPERPRRQRQNRHIQLDAKEILTLQRLAQTDILNSDDGIEVSTLLSIERVLRHYAQYHFEKPIRSAELIETCFAST